MHLRVYGFELCVGFGSRSLTGSSFVGFAGEWYREGGRHPEPQECSMRQLFGAWLLPRGSTSRELLRDEAGPSKLAQGGTAGCL